MDAALNSGYQVVIARDVAAGTPAYYIDAIFEHTLGNVATINTTAPVLDTWGASH